MRDTSHFSRAPIALACMSVVSTVLFGVLSSISAADVIPLASPGAVSGGGFGESVSIVPDLNGDGWKDLVIGAPREPVAGVAQAGRVHVIDGRTWAVIRTHDAPGAEAAGWFGTAVLGLPDINGDGQGDYCVGAPGQGPNDRGVVYAFSGATGALLWTALGVGGADMNGWGGCLALVPDASGDGYPELVVGHVSAPAQPATVRVLHATSGGTWKTLQKEAGGGAFTRWGHAVGGVADLNGDARGDVLIGAPNWDTNAGQDAGLVYVYSGATGEFIGEIASPGAQPFGRFGTSVAGVPDLDGDGNGDVAVGAPGEIPVALAVRCGQAHVFSGASLSGLYTVGSSEPVEQGAFGAAIAGAADMNDDGAGDIVIGAPLEGSGSSLGRVYVVSGAQGSSIRAPLASSLAGSSFGSALATGDVTHDGRPDLIAGAPQLSSFGLPNAGRAELHRIVVNDACDLDAMLPEVG